MSVHIQTHSCDNIYTHIYIHVLLTVISLPFSASITSSVELDIGHFFFKGHCLELMTAHREKDTYTQNKARGSHIGCEFYSLPFSSHNPPHVCSHIHMKAR